MSINSYARGCALIGLLGFETTPNEVRQLTIFEARRRLIYAVNTWNRRCHEFIRAYTIKEQFADGSQAGTTRKEVVTLSQLDDDLVSYENLLDEAVKFGSTLLAWA